MIMEEPGLLIGIILGILGALGLAFLLGQRRRESGPEIANLAGRVEQMAASQSALHAALNDSLMARERALADTLDRRFTTLADRLGQGMQTSAQEASKSLSDLKERLAVIDAAQANLLALSNQVVDLHNVLSNKQARGAFGETQLADIVQSTLPAQNFELQAQIGTKRVDCLLRLPNPPGSIAIDAKFPLEAWRALHDARDDAQISEARRQFIVAIRGHVRAISEKYIVPGETADSALMFLPSEAVYAELHVSFPELVEEAGRSRVWIVSPTTLMATLTTIRSVLRDVRMREQAHLVQASVAELAKDVERLDERVKNLQRHFDQANTDVREITISVRKIVDRAAKIGEIEPGDAEPVESLSEPDTAETRLN